MCGTGRDDVVFCACFPGSLGTLFGTYSSEAVALAAIEKHKKEQDVPAEVIFRIFSYELDEEMPVNFCMC